MARIEVAANQVVQSIPEGMSLIELAIISNTNSRSITHKEKRVRAAQKNMIFNLAHLRILWETYPAICDELVLKINKAKLMKFIKVESKNFHPYLDTEFYQRAVIPSTFKEGTINIEKKYWNKWKLPEDKSIFKLATKKGSLGLLPGMMLDILVKIIIQYRKSVDNKI